MTAEPQSLGSAQSSPSRPVFSAGDRMPDFALPTGPQQARSFRDCFTGPPAVLLVAASTRRARLLQALKALQADSGLAATCLVIEQGPVGAAPAEAGADTVWLFDPDGQVSAALLDGSAATGEAAIAIDREQRVIGRRESLEDCAPWALELLAKEVLDLSTETTGFHAPVLTVRGVLEPALCRRLIEDWSSDHQEGGVRRAQDGAAAMLDAAEANVDHGVKKRLDHYPGPEMSQLLGRRVQDRIGPELWRAFRYRTPYLERFIVGCYEAGRGDYFRPHRDDSTPGTKHRAFALTINLNDDYEGGGLRFPEYGGALYVTPPGGAIVFSCSLLHEAVPVTHGTRYVALSFLVDPQAAQERRQKREAGRATP